MAAGLVSEVWLPLPPVLLLLPQSPSGMCTTSSGPGTQWPSWIGVNVNGAGMRIHLFCFDFVPSIPMMELPLIVLGSPTLSVPADHWDEVPESSRTTYQWDMQEL